MIVYVEYAFFENTLIDGLLLYLAIKCARQKISRLHLISAAIVGGAEAIVFPLFTLPIWATYLVKLLGGALITVIAVRRGRLKNYLITVIAFFAFTFALGGLLTAVYSFFNVEYVEGQGYFIESAPVGLIIAGTGIFAVICAHLVNRAYRFRKVQQNIVDCTLVGGGRTVKWKGLVDSGNLLAFHSRPVNVLSPIAALALFGRGAKEVGRIEVKTANGRRERPVFECESMTVRAGKDRLKFENVLFTTGEVDAKAYQFILHTAFTEACHEDFGCTQIVVAKDKGE